MNFAIERKHARIAVLPPETREPITHKELISDRAAKDKNWRADGCQLLWDVLDEKAVDRLLGIYVKEFEKLGISTPLFGSRKT